MCLLYVFLETSTFIFDPLQTGAGESQEQKKEHSRAFSKRSGTPLHLRRPSHPSSSSVPVVSQNFGFPQRFPFITQATRLHAASHQRRSAETSLCDAFRTPVAPVKLENGTKQEKSSYAAKVQHRSFFLPSLLSWSKGLFRKDRSGAVSVEATSLLREVTPHPPTQEDVSAASCSRLLPVSRGMQDARGRGAFAGRGAALLREGSLPRRRAANTHANNKY